MLANQPKEIEDDVDDLPIRRALISVFDKSGLKELAAALTALGVELVSTGGSEAYLRSAGFAVKGISDLTNFPEMLDGRVKTLHPNVHGGLLFRRELSSHRAQAAEHGIEPIDLLVSNLYPFEETVAKPGITEPEVIEQIDIGGPAMVRSAAKNFKGVALLTSPEQYASFIEKIQASNGFTELSYRKNLAAEAFRRVTEYDEAISNYFEASKLRSSVGPSNGKVTTEGSIERNRSIFDKEISLKLPRSLELRYGENPQQHAALYGNAFLSVATQLWGKELSYNNILDSSSALGLIAEFVENPNFQKPVTAIIKHTNPCGIAEGETALDAFNRAFSSDPESPFGGVIVTTARVDAAFAQRLNEFFSEVLLAPDFAPEALEVLKKKKDRRLLRFHSVELLRLLKNRVEYRSVIGGMLAQENDQGSEDEVQFHSITERPLSANEERAARFAWKVVKHVKSNAIVYAGLEQGFAKSLGIGAGQTSRVESSRIAVQHAQRYNQDLRGSIVASDAFFPFADGLVEAAKVGATVGIEPGGSVRDQEVIAAAKEHKLSLVMTGVRHFKH